MEAMAGCPTPLVAVHTYSPSLWNKDKMEKIDIVPNWFQLYYIFTQIIFPNFIDTFVYLSVNIDQLEGEAGGGHAGRQAQPRPPGPGHPGVRLTLGRAAQGVVITLGQDQLKWMLNNITLSYQREKMSTEKISNTDTGTKKVRTRILMCPNTIWF